MSNKTIDLTPTKTGSDTANFFIKETMNKCLDRGAREDDPKTIFYDYLFQNELCVMFSDTGLGKTILAVQIAKEFCDTFPNEKVLYFDFELNGKSHEMRYRNEKKEICKFSDDLIRLEINFDKQDLEITPEIIIGEIKKATEENEAKFVIIDNITYLENELHRPDKASVLIKKLKNLKTSLNITLLALAHTPKRDESKPITPNSMSGSKNIANFIDNLFAIGLSSQDTSFRYLKRLKFRNHSADIEVEEIRLFEIKRNDEGFLHFEFIENGKEYEHLKESNKDDRDKRIMELHKEGKSCREIANELGISKSTVNNVIQKSNKN